MSLYYEFKDLLLHSSAHDRNLPASQNKRQRTEGDFELLMQGEKLFCTQTKTRIANDPNSWQSHLCQNHERWLQLNETKWK